MLSAETAQSESGESWLLKVGEEYDSVDDIRGALLLHVEGYGLSLIHISSRGVFPQKDKNIVKNHLSLLVLLWYSYK